MSFQPVVLGVGMAAWRFVERTYDTQLTEFNKSAVLQRDSEYFEEHIGSITTAEELVSDRRLLAVALGAFGLGEDLNNKYFIRKVLEDGTKDDDALANRLADDRYAKFSKAFGFGPAEDLKTGYTSKMTVILEKYKTQEFEIAMGNTDETMRIALFTQHALVELAESDSSEEALWFKIMGTPPLRSFFETALGLPKSFGAIDIDRQLVIFQDRIGRLTGDDSVSQFSDPEVLERITTTYLTRSQLSGFSNANSSASNALLLLQSISNNYYNNYYSYY